MDNLLVNTIDINGSAYYDLQTFADLTNRSAQSIRLLVGKGNRFRKIGSIHVGRLIFISKNELVEFPFAQAGRSKLVDRFKADGSHYSERVE